MPKKLNLDEETRNSLEELEEWYMRRLEVAATELAATFRDNQGVIFLSNGDTALELSSGSKNTLGSYNYFLNKCDYTEERLEQVRRLLSCSATKVYDIR